MKHLDKVKKEVESFTDKNGTKVDKDIFNLVVALRLHGFNTVNSCQGHVKEKTLMFFPYVGITETTTDKAITKYKKNVAQLSRLINLLNLFYKKRPTNYKNMLICVAGWENGGFTELRPNSGLSSAYEVRDLDKRTELNKQYLDECNHFAEFLIELYKKNAD